MQPHTYTCKLHKTKHIDVVPLSPYRGTCNVCGEKKVHGYSNPDHITNSFCYLYLTPTLCLLCSEATKSCMWCK